MTREKLGEMIVSSADCEDAVSEAIVRLLMA